MPLDFQSTSATTVYHIQQSQNQYVDEDHVSLATQLTDDDLWLEF